MIKNYISYSEFYRWSKDINQYYVEYILGVKPPPTKEMEFGSIIHQAIAEDSDPEPVLVAKNFTSDFVRVAKDLIKVPRAEHRELKLYVEGFCKVPIVIILDGVNLPGEIVEYKSTKNGWRTQQEVDEHEQITLYTGGYHFLTKTLPTTSLYRLDTGNGKIKKFETTRTLAQIEQMKQNINRMYDDLVQREWWERRLTKSSWFVDETKRVCQTFLSQFTMAMSPIQASSDSKTVTASSEPSKP